MSFTEFGEKLREHREAYGYSFDYVATQLKLSRRLVQAMEAATKEELPHAVYTRGFLRSYARLLNIDSAEVDAVLDAVYPLESQEDFLKRATPITPPRKCGYGRLVTIILLLSALLFACYFYYRQASGHDAMLSVMGLSSTSLETSATAEEAPSSPDATSSSVPAPTAGVVESVEIATPVGSAVDTPATNTETLSESSSVAGSVVEGETSVGVGVENVSSSSVATTLDGVASSENVSSAAEAIPSPQKVTVKALGECWVQATTDGKSTRQALLKKGQTFSATFEEKLIIKLGNAGMVSLRYNGKEMPAPGAKGTVTTLTFPLQ